MVFGEEEVEARRKVAEVIWRISECMSVVRNRGTAPNVSSSSVEIGSLISDPFPERYNACPTQKPLIVFRRPAGEVPG